MRRIFFVFLIAAFCSPLYSGVITEMEARKKAQQFVGGKRLLTNCLVRGKTKDYVNANLYIFNIENDGGFVIVSGDDRTPAILGFADNGRMDIDQMPSNVAAWLDGYSRQISLLANDARQKESRAMSAKADIAPLINTTWDQGSPYNQFLIEIDGLKVATGCAATAMAQIMRYYSFPEASKALPSYISTTHIKYIEALPASIFDWNEMGTGSKPVTDDEGKHIAKLMKYCGVATNMDYSPYGSGTYVHTVESAFKDYFFYDSANMVDREDYSTDADWETLIYNELDNDCPVFYGGVAENGGGHAFICDGYRYDDGNYFHINWGWGGSCDGYFLLSTLDSHNNGNGYSKEQSAIIGLKPGQYTRPENIDYEDDIRKAEEYEASLVWPFNTFDFEITSSNTVSVDAHKNTISGDVVIPDVVTIDGSNYQVTSINSGFWHCDDIESITLPETMQTVFAAMNSCKSLKRVYFPASVQSVSLSLNNCAVLSDIEVSPESSWLTTYDGMLYTKDMTTLVIAPYALSQTSFIIPEGVETMTYAFAGNQNVRSISLPSSLVNSVQAFSACRGLTTVELADGLATLSEKTFEGCTAITSVTANCKSPKAIDENTFASVVYSQAVLTVPYGCASIYRETSGWKKFNNIVEQERPEDLPVKVKANSYSRTYGDANPVFDYTVTDGPLTGIVSLTCTATASSEVGTYPIVVSVTGDDNVDIVDGTLTINPATLDVSAASYTIRQGEKLPDYEVSYNGFKLDENEGVLDVKATASCNIADSNQPGEYEIAVSGVEAKNYVCNYHHGKLTVLGPEPTPEPDPVTVTAKSYTREYGEPNPVFDYEAEGAALDGEPVITCDATSSSPVGEYAIIVSKGSVKNYNDRYVAGVLTISKAKLVVTASSYTKKQYDAMPEFAVSYEGFVNDETEAVLVKLPTISCEANDDSKPGEYDITVSGAEAGNYDISYVAGKLTVTEPDSFKLTYLVDGEVYKEYYMKYREEITPEQEPVKQNCIFSGWSEIPQTMPAENVTVTGFFTSTGISNALQSDLYIVRIYSVDGKLQKELQRGVNIVWMSDGTRKKVIVK